MLENILNLDYIKQFLRSHQLPNIEEGIISACQHKLTRTHGDVDRWQAAVNSLPHIDNPVMSTWHGYVELLGHCNMADAEIEQILKLLCPWRKGPFKFLNNKIDSEWRSDNKWRRIQEIGVDFHGKNVLDIGCGNGFFMWQIQSAGAKSVVGVDPMWLFYHQFMVMQRYANNPHLCFLPLGVEHIVQKNSFDSVLSMGVLYHRKSPLEHLLDLKSLLKKGGELILETIVLPDSGRTLLTPPDRYAGMRNVWMVSSVSVLYDWLHKIGFSVTGTSEVQKTTLQEQRQTEWMDFHSLNQFLDSKDDSKTIEGHPAPYRVIITATS